MPTYEYACAACGHKFEEFQSITAAPIRKCPVCKKSKVQRLISSGAGFIFKGSGFYITDYRSDAYKNAAKSDSPAGATAGTATKTEAGKTETSKTESTASKPAETSTAGKGKDTASGSVKKTAAA